MHRKRIEGYQQVMGEVTTQILDRWQPGVAIDVAREMDDLALIIEGRTLFSMDLSETEHTLSDAVTQETSSYTPLTSAAAEPTGNEPSVALRAYSSRCPVFSPQWYACLSRAVKRHCFR
jgi:cytochrome P450